MKYRATDTFWKSYKRLDNEEKEIADEKFALFIKNPRHPSLRTKRMQGKRNIWEGHVSESIVFTWRYTTDEATGEAIIETLNIGSHDIYKSV